MANKEIDATTNGSAHRHPEMEHFLNLNTILHSLVDFIRPETYISPDELETYNELKEKFLHESTTKRTKQVKSQGQSGKSPLEVAGVQSIRTTSGIYRFLAHHQKMNASTDKSKSTPSVSREELLKKLHDKMPHRQQQMENGVKRKRSTEKSVEREKRPRTSTKVWSATPSAPQVSKPSIEKPSVIPTNIKFGRFEFDRETPVGTTANKKNNKPKKFQTKEKQLINTLKQVESEQHELKRLREENPEEGKEVSRSKSWQSALAKAKGEKVRDNVQLLRKSIKKQTKLRERSAKKWQKNKAETDKRLKERVEKRKTNIQKRKDEKKAKIKKRLIKKGRLVN